MGALAGRSLPPKEAASRNIQLTPDLRDLSRLPTLKAAVKFPYLQVGDDFYSAGAFLWTDLGLDTSLVPGTNPHPCARAEAGVRAEAGADFELFGVRGGVSRQIFEHGLPPAAVPARPACTAE